jgi:hypothetical protein
VVRSIPAPLTFNGGIDGVAYISSHWFSEAFRALALRTLERAIMHIERRNDLEAEAILVQAIKAIKAGW